MEILNINAIRREETYRTLSFVLAIKSFRSSDIYLNSCNPHLTVQTLENKRYGKN